MNKNRTWIPLREGIDLFGELVLYFPWFCCCCCCCSTVFPIFPPNIRLRYEVEGRPLFSVTSGTINANLRHPALLEPEPQYPTLLVTDILFQALWKTDFHYLALPVYSDRSAFSIKSVEKSGTLDPELQYPEFLKTNLYYLALLEAELHYQPNLALLEHFAETCNATMDRSEVFFDISDRKM